MNMTYNLFSMFDPSSSFMSLSWASFLFILPIMKSPKTMMNSKKTFSTLTILNQISKEITQLMEKKSRKFSPPQMKTMFYWVFMINLMALIPFNFTLTAHISISFTVSISMWLSLALYAWLKNFKMTIIHLTPTGTPNQLMNFMVIIEMISNIIRPITLSVRLTANMVAGHLLMSLLSNFSLMSNTQFILSIAPLLTLSMLEIMVSMVQAYVLTMLITLYYNESI